MAPRVGFEPTAARLTVERKPLFFSVCYHMFALYPLTDSCGFQRIVITPDDLYVLTMFRRYVTPKRSRIMLSDERRVRFEELAAEHRASFAELSRILGRGDSYVSDYLRRKVPYDLAAADSGKLARFFGVDPDTLRPLRQPTSLRSRLTTLPRCQDRGPARNPDQGEDWLAEGGG